MLVIYVFLLNSFETSAGFRKNVSPRCHIEKTTQFNGKRVQPSGQKTRENYLKTKDVFNEWYSQIVKYGFLKKT